MARVMIYVIDELRARMIRHPAENWSAVAQAAFQTRLTTLECDAIHVEEREMIVHPLLLAAPFKKNAPK